MIKLDHLEISVVDAKLARDFYVQNFGFSVEFEVPERNVIAVRDGFDFRLLLAEQPDAVLPRSCVITLQVDDVGRTYAQLKSQGVAFISAPSPVFWGYGAELSDPSGYLIRLWDAASMRKYGKTG